MAGRFIVEKTKGARGRKEEGRPTGKDANGFGWGQIGRIKGEKGGKGLEVEGNAPWAVPSNRIGAWNLFLGFLFVFSFNAVFLISFPTLSRDCS